MKITPWLDTAKGIKPRREGVRLEGGRGRGEEAGGRSHDYTKQPFAA